MNIQRINPCPRWSDVTVYNGIAYFVEVPEDTSVDIAGQLIQVLRQTEYTLEKVGADKTRLLSVSIYITDRSHLPIINDIWESWLPVGCAPSRACLKVELVNPSMLVEIAFVAAINQ